MTRDFKEAFEKTKIAGYIAAGALDEISKIIIETITSNCVSYTEFTSFYLRRLLYYEIY